MLSPPNANVRRAGPKVGEYGINAVDRALEVLAVFQQGKGALSLADLMRATQINKTSVLRICSSFERRGYLRRDSRGRWGLGPAASALGKHYEADIHLDDVVIPALIALAKSCQESASFHVRVGDARLCIYRVNADHSLVDNVRTGDCLPLDRGAPGIVLLAWGNELPADLAKTRNLGYAVSFGDRDPLCAAVAVPVFKFQGELCGALSLSGPKTRFTQRYAREMLPRVAAAAAQMSTGLGAPLSEEHRPASVPTSSRASGLGENLYL